MQKLRKVTSPKQTADLASLRADLESWRKELTEYEDESKEVVSDSYRKLALMDLVTPTLREHLELNSSRLVSFDDLWSAIDSYLSNKEDSSTTGTPMDLDALEAKGKGKI